MATSEETTSVRIARVKGHTSELADDQVAVEEPLAVDIEHGPEDARARVRLFTTMRTPGDDLALVRGMLRTEGVITGEGDLLDISASASNEASIASVLARLSPKRELADRLLGRRVIRSSACGVCGSERLDLVRGAAVGTVGSIEARVDASLLEGLPRRMTATQSAFRRTGGTHAAALFSPDGELLCLREDIGRHNALDKLIGTLGPRTKGNLLMLSSRASYELIQKAWVAGIPVVATVGAPTSLAIEAARMAEITLCCFVREAALNVYARPERIVGLPAFDASKEDR